MQLLCLTKVCFTFEILEKQFYLSPRSPLSFKEAERKIIYLTTSFVWNKSANGTETCFNSGRERHQQEQDQDKKSQCKGRKS